MRSAASERNGEHRLHGDIRPAVARTAERTLPVPVHGNSVRKIGLETSLFRAAEPLKEAAAEGRRELDGDVEPARSGAVAAIELASRRRWHEKRLFEGGSQELLFPFLAARLRRGHAGAHTGHIHLAESVFTHRSGAHHHIESSLAIRALITRRHGFPSIRASKL